MSVRPQDTAELHLEQIMYDLENGTLYDARAHLHDLHATEIALLLRSLPIDYRYQIWTVISTEVMGEVLVALQGEVRVGLIDHSSAKDLIASVNHLESREVADLVSDFPATIREKILNIQSDSRLESALSYDGHTAARLMRLDVLTVKKSSTVDSVLAYLRQQDKLPSNMDSLIVVDDNGKYEGMVAISSVLTNKAAVLISSLMNDTVEAISLNMPVSEVALIFERKDMISAAVVNEQGGIEGRITLDEVLDVVREEADHAVLISAGLDEEHDLFSPVLVSAKRRAVWLGVNLFTAFLASWVIGLFEATIEEIVALAVLMPVVASMGGIAGSQTLTLVIRGLALHQISSSNAGSFLLKELSVGALNGLVWSTIVASVAGFWFSNYSLGLMLGGAMVITLSCAALAGVLIPLFLHKRGIDPALAGGVLLTTVTDVIGFMSFLGLATIFLIN